MMCGGGQKNDSNPAAGSEPRAARVTGLALTRRSRPEVAAGGELDDAARRARTA